MKWRLQKTSQNVLASATNTKRFTFNTRKAGLLWLMWCAECFRQMTQSKAAGTRLIQRNYTYSDLFVHSKCFKVMQTSKIRYLSEGDIQMASHSWAGSHCRLEASSLHLTSAALQNETALVKSAAVFDISPELWKIIWPFLLKYDWKTNFYPVEI